MADTFETTGLEAGGAKSTILRLIRPSASTSNSGTAVLRAEIEGFRLALSIAQDALREERCDKEHWRDEAKRLRQLLSGHETKPAIITVPEPKAVPEAIEALALAPPVEPEQENSPNSEMAPATHSVPPAPHPWWWRLRSSGKALLAQATRMP
jgi:hypothetical protein